MLWNIFWLLVGALIAWNIPQPSWAEKLTDKIKDKVDNFFDDVDERNG